MYMVTEVLGPSVRVDALTTGNVGLKGPGPLKWTVCFRFPHCPRSYLLECNIWLSCLSRADSSSPSLSSVNEFGWQVCRDPAGACSVCTQILWVQKQKHGEPKNLVSKPNGSVNFQPEAEPCPSTGRDRHRGWPRTGYFLAPSALCPVLWQPALTTCLKVDKVSG